LAKWATIAMAGTAVATIILAGFTYNSTRYLKRREMRERIKHMILKVVEKGIDEFKSLKNYIQKNNQGELIGLPKHIYLSDTYSILDGAAWGDFARECKELFKFNESLFATTKDYLKKKYKYLKIRNECRKLIKEHLVKSDVLTDEMATFLNKQTDGTTISKHEILQEIAESILRKIGYGIYGKEFYEKFKDELLPIRDKKDVKDKIIDLMEITKEIEKYKHLEKNFEKIKSKLMRKYSISDFELDELREKIKKDLYDDYTIGMMDERKSWERENRRFGF